MSKEITNGEILQAIMELGEHQKEMSGNIKALSQQQHVMLYELKEHNRSMRCQEGLNHCRNS